MNDEMRSTFEQAFEYHGMTLLQMLVCDYRNSQDVEEMLKESDFVLLAGGHVPTQNAFFHQIRLRELMRTFDGIVMGISAGTMNSADVVYAQPELAGESLDSDYQRYIEGLNLTWVNVLPHYQEVKDNLLDGRRLMEDITYSDSWGHRFYALIDGSYILVENGRTEIFGEAYLISDGTISKICEKGQSMRIER